jgi:hypothetical protein
MSRRYSHWMRASLARLRLRIKIAALKVPPPALKRRNRNLGIQ